MTGEADEFLGSDEPGPREVVVVVAAVELSLGIVQFSGEGCGVAQLGVGGSGPQVQQRPTLGCLTVMEDGNCIFSGTAVWGDARIVP